MTGRSNPNIVLKGKGYEEGYERIDWGRSSSFFPNIRRYGLLNTIKGIPADIIFYLRKWFHPWYCGKCGFRMEVTVTGGKQCNYCGRTYKEGKVYEYNWPVG
jgi:hypothetical protein